MLIQKTKFQEKGGQSRGALQAAGHKLHPFGGRHLWGLARGCCGAGAEARPGTGKTVWWGWGPDRAAPLPDRGVRYIDKKLSKADKSMFLKLSANYRYRKMEILKLSKTYRYRKMHQIWSDKYMKSQRIRILISAKFYPKNARKITHSCIVTMKSSPDSILIFLHTFSSEVDVSCEKHNSWTCLNKYMV